ncbi:MAG TPA: signal peptidase II [Beijerinckiaceae bacterium]|nr:signal peptidase II [Beijerinckiaceae bacterium]
MSRVNPRLIGVAAAACALLADQASKYWLLDIFGIAARQPVRITPFFDLVMAWNQGISYSLFTTRTTQGRWILIAATLAATAALAFWMWRAREQMTCLALGLVVGGALGNALDRWVHGAVADFFYFHVGKFSWYVFNLADCAIVAGVGLLLYESFFLKEKPGAEPA